MEQDIYDAVRECREKFPLTNTSYIANLKVFDPSFREIAKTLADNNWPCVISNDVIPGKEYPNCDSETARTVSEARLTLIKDSSWFLLFQDNSNHISQIELGIALASDLVKMVALIGGTKNATYHCHSKIIPFSNWANFTARMFIP